MPFIPRPTTFAAILTLGALSACGGNGGATEGAQDAGGDDSRVEETGARDSGMMSHPDGAPLGPGVSGTSLAAGGSVSTTKKYKILWTLGQGPGGNDSSKSSKYTLRGGVVGATQGY
jgi:hypothetical protein